MSFHGAIIVDPHCGYPAPHDPHAFVATNGPTLVIFLSCRGVKPYSLSTTANPPSEEEAKGILGLEVKKGSNSGDS